MRYSKEDIVNEYKKLRVRIGRPPDSVTFYRESRISKGTAEVAFGSKAFSKIQRAAGDEPREFVKPGRTKDEFLETYGQIVREFQSIPTEADWKHSRIKPTPSGYRRKLGLRWSELPNAFRGWAIDRPDWKDIVAICDSSSPPKGVDGKESSPETYGYVYLIKSGKFHKIGRTNSPGRRGYEVALQLPEEIETVHLIKTDDPVGVEAYWHERFKDKRKKGEFFELPAEDIRAFKRWKKIW